MTSSPLRCAGVLLLACIVSACGPQTSAPAPLPTVAVSTAQPVTRTFHRRVSAIGTIVGNPQHTRHLSLAHGGEVVAVMVRNGQFVHAGEALLKVAAAPTTRQAYRQAQSALTLARRALARQQKLAEQQLATQGDVDTARNVLSDANAALQAQRRLGGAHATNTVIAPADGVITHVDVTPGQRVSAGATLATFAPAHDLLARVGIQPSEADDVAAGMPAIVHMVYGATQDIHGKVTMVGHAIDPATRLVPVEVTLPAAWAAHAVVGTAVSARIRTSSFSAWAIPRDAVQRDAQGLHVFQIEDGKAKRVDVKVLATQGDPLGVTGALDPHAPLITLGSYEIADGDAVATAPPAHGSSTQ